MAMTCQQVVALRHKCPQTDVNNHPASLGVTCVQHVNSCLIGSGPQRAVSSNIVISIIEMCRILKI